MNRVGSDEPSDRNDTGAGEMNRQRRATRRQRRGAGARTAGVLRVAGLGLVLGLVFCALCWRSAHAQMGETLLGYGQELMRWAEARPNSNVRTLRLNGAELRVVSLSVSQPLDVTLDRLEANCGRKGGFALSQELRERMEASVDNGAQPKQLTTFSRRADDRGAVACFDMGGTHSVDEVMQRVQRFTESGDFSDIGHIRYAFAERGERGTHVVALWSDGPVPLRRMFPQKGDAPGVDPQEVPRPPEARRILSAAEQGQPYSVTVYQLQQPAESWDGYLEALREHDWTLRATANPGVFSARRGERTLIFRLAPTRDAVSIAELS